MFTVDAKQQCNKCNLAEKFSSGKMGRGRISEFYLVGASLQWRETKRVVVGAQALAHLIKECL